jgi:hypothetical protein
LKSKEGAKAVISAAFPQRHYRVEKNNKIGKSWNTTIRNHNTPNITGNNENSN